MLPRSMLLLLFAVGTLGQQLLPVAPSLRAHHGVDQEQSSLVQLWRPFSPSATKNRTSESDACAVQLTCGKCNDVSFCHWCDKDQACHVMGSVHGCLSGSNCLNPTPPNPTDKNDTSCYSHRTCSECGLASHLCHWCGHDNACHAIGSIHGCTVGVDCFSNARCERRQPEPVKSIVFTQMGWKPFCLLLLVAVSGLVCVLSCWCVNAHIKGAYDDLAHAFLQGQPPSRPPRSRAASTVAATAVPPSPERPSSATAAAATEVPPATLTDIHVDDEDEPEAVVRRGHHHSNGSGNHVDEYVRLVDGSEDDNSESDLPQATLRLPHMSRLYSACVGCHITSLVTIVVLVAATIRYYPKIPEYNICNDRVAWSSLMASLTSLKATADFEILASVSNLNHFDIVLERGSKGSFRHAGVAVGTFDIPPVRAAALSLTDVLVVAHLTPEKWDALSLTAEYYRGALVLDVDVTAKIRIPALWNFGMTRTLRDIEVHVNELADRRLCACEDWDSARNRSAANSVLVLEVDEDEEEEEKGEEEEEKAMAQPREEEDDYRTQESQPAFLAVE